MKRFYKDVTAGPEGDGFAVRLDRRPVRTPGRSPLILPTAPLAQAVAAEWAEQGEDIKPRSMPLTTLASTAIDRVSPNREAVVASTAGYAETDLLCYRADHPTDLTDRQNQAWQPLLDWAERSFKAPLAVTHGLMPASQPVATLTALRGAVEGYDVMRLTALSGVTALAGSVVIGLALVEGRINAGEAHELAHLDETYQIELWGDDPEAAERRAGIAEELLQSRRFIDLL